MIFKCVKILNILFCILLFVSKTSFSQECSSDEINCISCTEYRNCSVDFPEGRVISCKFGDSCSNDQLKECQMKLNCYALNECTQAGIFPDVTVDSNYFVCLNDAASGFLKYEFTCPEENFFDKGSLTCVPRDVTLVTSEDPSSSSVSTESSSPSTSTDSPSTSTSLSSLSPSASTDLTSPTVSTSSTSSSPNPTSSTSTSSTSSTSVSTSTDPTSSSSTTSTSSTSTPSSTSADPTSSTSTPSSTSTDPTSSTSTSSTSSTTSVSSTSSITPTTPTVPSPTTPPFACMASGIFPNPDNCKMYYRCSTSLKAFFYICPGNSYFNENILKCSMIITPACQEQILKNSTSTIPPTTTSATITPTTATTLTSVTTSTTSTITSTTTSTPSTTTSSSTTTTTPTTTTTSTTTTTPSSSTPFSCPMTGIFADPLNCKIYYRCALSGQIFQYVCPGNTYFNEFTKRCSLSITPRCRNLIQGY